jgi:hypothetical protein
MPQLNTRREGFALVGAIAALVLIGVLVTGGFVAATQEGAISESTRYSSEAFNAAEVGMNEVVGTWQVADYQAAPKDTTLDLCRNGTSAAVGACQGGAPIGRYAVSVSPLGGSGELFLVRSRGELPRHGRLNRPERTLARVVRISDFNIAMDRAVTVGGPLKLGGTAEINGQDAIPSTFANKDKCTDTGKKTGVVARDTAAVTQQGNARIEGEPRKRSDPSIDGETFAQFGNLTYEDLAKMANFKIPNQGLQTTAPKLTANGRCDYGEKSNWGAPKDSTHACRNFFPIVHVEGSLHINAQGQGQGILLVDGDLKLNGGYEFYGIVIVRGTLQGGNGGAKIYGGTFVRGGAELENPSEVQGNPVVNLSTCAITRAIQNNDNFAYARPISSRSWFDLSALGAGT